MDIRASAALECQSGAYCASIAELDELIDVCRNSGAISASLTGAGLGGVVTVVIEESHVASLRERLIAHFERNEDHEVERVLEAVRLGRLQPELLTAIRSLVHAKRRGRGVRVPFVPDADQKRAIDICARELVVGNNSLVRLLPIDYYRSAVVRNVSVAGAGYLPAPN